MNDNDITHEIIGAAIEVHRVLGQVYSKLRMRNALHTNFNHGK